MAGMEDEAKLRDLLARSEVDNLVEHLHALDPPCTKRVHLLLLTDEDFASLRLMRGVQERDVQVLEKWVRVNRSRKGGALGGGAACFSPTRPAAKTAGATRAPTRFPGNLKPQRLGDLPDMQDWSQISPQAIADAIMLPGLGLERLPNAHCLSVGSQHETSGPNGRFKSKLWGKWCVLYGFPRIQGNVSKCTEVARLLADTASKTSYTKDTSKVLPTKAQMELVNLWLDWTVHETRRRAAANTPVHTSVCVCASVSWSTSCR